MVRTNTDADDETPAENPPAFADLIDTVDDLEEGDKTRVVYAHKTRHTLSEPDTTTPIEGYVTVADTTFDDDRTRFRLEFQSSDPASGYTGSQYRVKDGGVNKTHSNPCFVSKSTGPSVRHFEQLGRVDSIEVLNDEVDEDDLPEVGDKFVDTNRDRVYTVEDVGDLYDKTVLYGSDEADTFDEFVAAVDAGHLIPVADTASETTRRVLEAKGADDTDAFAAAINEPMNDDERHAIRFVATRDEGVDFDFATGIAEWFEVDQIVAEHYDVVEACREAFDVLRDAADLRTVSTGRNGVIEVDPDTGRVDAVSLYEHAFDIAGDRTHDDVAAEMLACFDVDDTTTDDDAHGCKVVADDPEPVTDGGDSNADVNLDPDADVDASLPDDPSCRVNVSGFVEVPGSIVEDGDVEEAVNQAVEDGDFFVDGHDVVERPCDKCGRLVSNPDNVDLSPPVCEPCRHEMAGNEPRTDGGEPKGATDEDVAAAIEAAEEDDDPELVTDGGTPTCEACDRDELTRLPDDDNRGAFACDWCGAFVDDDGRLPRADDKRCPNCHGQVAYGVLKDARKGIRGYLCVGECEERRIVRPEDDAPVATDGGRHRSDVDKCGECGRRAPHAFDHAVGCSRFEPIEDEPVTTYVVDREYATTDAQEAESFARRGAHVTATTSRSPHRHANGLPNRRR